MGLRAVTWAMERLSLLLLLPLAWHLLPASAAGIKCESIADTYFDRHHTEPSPYTGQNLAYFLHVPRTAGRTFHTCFLKLGTPVARQCPNTYDHLRINVSMPNCYLLSSHDDFSVVSLLPKDIAVMTHVRDPVERFLSAYEFAVEVAARTFQRSGPAPRKDPRRVNTEDVWPWSFLVPFFSKDMHDRRVKLLEEPQSPEGNWIQVTGKDNQEFYFNKHKDKSKWNLTAEEQALLLPPLDPYNNPLAMSLEEFAQHPIARELLHNGQAFQVLGITNYSHWGDAAQMRDCMWDSPAARSHLQEVALTRLSRFFHVGVTDRLRDSVAAAAVAMKFNMYQMVPKQQQTQGARQVSSGGRGFRKEAPSSEQLAQEQGNGELAAQLKVLAAEEKQAQQHMQALKEQLFESNQQGKTGAEKAALEAQVQEARNLLVEKQAAMLKLAADAAALSPEPRHTAHTGIAAAGTLGLEFLKCARTAQTRNLERRARSFTHVFLMDGRGLRFSKAARKNIPESVIQKIRQYNSMDLALHATAERMLSTRRQDWTTQDVLEELPDTVMADFPEMTTTMAYKIPMPEDPSAAAAAENQDAL